MTRIQPIASNVLIDPHANQQETTGGGIVIPDTAREKPQEGVVVAISPDATDQVQVGDRVIFKQFAGTPVSLENREYVIMPDSEILAKYVEADEI